MKERKRNKEDVVIGVPLGQLVTLALGGTLQRMP